MKCGLYHVNAGTETEAPAPLLMVTKLSSPTPDYAIAMAPRFSLALNPIADSVQYQISVIQASTPDTVTFSYTSQLVNISAICGDVYVNNLIKVSTTMHTLDSVKTVSSTINTTTGENIRIYF